MVTNETNPLVVNVTLTVANPIHISQQNAISGPTKIVLLPGSTKTPPAEIYHEYNPKVSNVKLPSYTSKNEFALRFSDLERGLSSVMEVVTYKAGTGSPSDDITTLKLSKDVSLARVLKFNFDIHLLKIFSIGWRARRAEIQNCNYWRVIRD